MLRACLAACAMLATTTAFAAAPPPLWRNLSVWEGFQVKALEASLTRHALLGDFEKATEASRQIAEFRRKYQGSTHWEAVDAVLEIEDWQRLAKVASKDRPTLLRVRRLNEQGAKLIEKGLSGKAEKPLREALAINKKVLGEDHPNTATSYNNLAACLEEQSKHVEALTLYRQALKINQKALSEGHAGMATSYGNVAHCLDNQGKYNEAVVLHQMALAIRQKALGEGHPDTATSYNNLAACLDHLGRYAEALPLYRLALPIRQKVLGEGHRDTADSYNNLASCLNTLGKHAEALDHSRRALAIRRKALGEGHPDTAVSFNNLASCLDDQGKHAEALPLYLKALAIRQVVLTEDHVNTATSYNNLAYCLQALGMHKDVLTLHKRALAIYQKVLDEEHPSIANSYNNIAFCVERQGKHAEALSLYKKALAIRRKRLGEEHPITAVTYNNMALCSNALGKHAEALTSHRRALAIFQKLLGEEHPATATSYINMASCLDSLGKQDEALRLLQRSLPGQEAARFHTASSGFDRALASSQKASPHAMLAVGLAKAGQPQNAFRHAEMALSRGLLDDLAGSAPEDLDRLATLTAEINALNTSILPLTTQLELSPGDEDRRARLIAQRGLLEGERARLASAISARQVLSLEQIQKQIPTNAALVLWIDGFGRRAACVLRHEGAPVWEQLPGSGKDGSWTKDDVDLARRAYASLIDPDTRDATRQALYKQCMAPLESHLKGVERLLVVPTAPMARIPVEALTDRWMVSYVPSGSAFARSAERSAAKRATSALVLADPVFTLTPPVYSKAPPHGLLIVAVSAGGVGQKIGLRPGDVLLEYADKALKAPGDLVTTKGDERIPIKLWRDGKPLGGRIPAGELGVVVDKKPVAEALAAWRVTTYKLTAPRGGKEWDALPGTRLEARSLEKLLPGATVRFGSDASEQYLEKLATEGKLKDIGILHIATHGEANQTRPRETALILAQDRLPTAKEQEARVLAGKRPVEGRLTVGTVLDGWKLDAELVTLSACQTGLGAETGGDGMLGFAQALLQKGTRSVVLSRWKVDDGATSLLMVRFYENLLGKRETLKGPMPKAEALRDAKKWLRELPREEALKRLATLVDGVPRGERGGVRPALPTKKPDAPTADRPYAHPYYWAAFVLIGDPR